MFKTPGGIRSEIFFVQMSSVLGRFGKALVLLSNHYELDWKLQSQKKINNPQVFSQMFWLFWPPFKRNSETNDISFERPDIQLLESEMKLGVASSWGLPCPLNWKSNTFSKTGVAPFMTKLFRFSFQISITTIQGFQKRYITDWLSKLLINE